MNRRSRETARHPLGIAPACALCRGPCRHSRAGLRPMLRRLALRLHVPLGRRLGGLH